MYDLPMGWNLARSLLRREAGDNPDPGVLVDALGRIWQELYRLFSPIIGAQGFRAIARRVLNQAQSEFPLLTGVDLGPQESAPLIGLRDRIAAQDPQQFAEAITYLLATFLSVLLQLLGLDLCRRLLRTAWPGIGCNWTSSVAGK